MGETEIHKPFGYLISKNIGHIFLEFSSMTTVEAIHYRLQICITQHFHALCKYYDMPPMLLNNRQNAVTNTLFLIAMRHIIYHKYANTLYDILKCFHHVNTQTVVLFLFLKLESRILFSKATYYTLESKKRISEDVYKGSCPGWGRALQLRGPCENSSTLLTILAWEQST